MAAPKGRQAATPSVAPRPAPRVSPSARPGGAPGPRGSPGPPAGPRKTATVNVLGEDKRGVIAKICTFLFQMGGNIEDLDQHVTQGLFTMQMVISWPEKELHEAQVRKGLEKLGKDLEMTILFRSHEGGPRKPRLGVLVTKEKHCLAAVLDAAARGRLPAEVAIVASNKPDLEPFCKARKVPFLYYSDRDKPAHEAAILSEFDKREVDYVVAARYMRILSPNFVWRYPNRIINIHPSLLPSFPGAQAYRQAWRKGVRIAGVTSHIVTMNLDEGPIVWQESYRVEPGDGPKEFARKGQALESEVLVKGLELLLEGKLDIHWGKAEIVGPR